MIKGFQYHSVLIFFKHSIYPYSLKERLFIRIELNSAGKVLSCTGDTNGTYKISDISLEYDTIFDQPYGTSIDEVYTGRMSTPYTKVTSIPFEPLKKNDTVWKIDVNNLSVRSLQELLLLFLDKRNNFANKNEEFCNPSINKILVTIKGMPHQLYGGGLQARDVYPGLKKYLHKENSNVTWEKFLTTKFALWIDTRSSTDSKLHGSRRAVEKSVIMVQIEKVSGVRDDNLMCNVFSLEDAVAHLSVTNPRGILTTEN